MFRQALSGLGCDCDGSGLGIVRADGMFSRSALAGLGDDTTVDPLTLNDLPDPSIFDTIDQVNTLAPGGNYSWGSNIPTGSINTSTGQPITAAQIAALIAGAATAAGSVYKSIQTPYVLPGTNVIYNPATGQYANAQGGVSFPGIGGALGTANLSLAGLMPLLLIGGLVLLVSGRGGGR